MLLSRVLLSLPKTLTVARVASALTQLRVPALLWQPQKQALRDGHQPHAGEKPGLQDMRIPIHSQGEACQRLGRSETKLGHYYYSIIVVVPLIIFIVIVAIILSLSSSSASVLWVLTCE